MEIKNRIDVYKELFTDLNLNHNKRILSYTNFQTEYRSFYESASVYDSSHSSFLYVTGKDAIDFLHRISTNDLLKQPDYTVTDTLFLNEKGRIIDKIRILKFPDHLILIGSPENEEKIYRWIERYAVMDDINVKQVGSTYLYLKILGRKREVLFTLLFGDQLKNLEPGKINKYISEQFQCWVYSYECLAGNLGYEIVCDSIYSESLLKYINSNLEVFNCHFIGFDALEVIRIEQGEPSFPNELNDAFNPYEVNLIKYVSFTKGCYIGQEVIARLDTYEKVKYNFSGFILESDYDFQDKMIYKNDGSVVGELTSKTYSPSLKSVVALGIYSKKLTDEDLQNLYVNSGDKKIKLIIKNLPMVQL